MLWGSTKNLYLMDRQIRGLKDGIYLKQYFGSILESLSLNFVYVNRCTHVILLPVGLQGSLLMIIKRILDYNLFLSSQKALTSNFHIFFFGSLVFNLRFEKFANHRLLNDSAENPVNTHRY